MTNREWTELIAKEFNVSNTVAKSMLSAMMTTKKIKSQKKEEKETTKDDVQKLCSNCIQSPMCYRYDPLFPKRAEGCYNYELARYLL